MAISKSQWRGNMVNRWTQSERRVQVHEIGHSVINFLTLRRTSDVAVAQLEGEHVGISEALGGGKKFEEMDRTEQLECVAGFWGGWAAVHLAISHGLLPSEPSGVEARPGDRGFYGAGRSDEWWVRYFSQRAAADNPDDFAEEARVLALSLLEPHISTIIELAKTMDGRGLLPAGELEQTLG